MRIFVDCDDTLLLYNKEAEKNPYGYWSGVPYQINKKLIDALIETSHWSEMPKIIIWSGGGEQYAKEILKTLNLPQYLCLSKDRTTFHLIQEGDIVIDDDNLGGKRTHDPFQWNGEEL